MNIIDLRSDTVTLPTKEMHEAISNAELGDDVFQEDPTINKLEKLAAKKFNKEAAIFLPSGTMANLVAVLTHCQRGDEVILGDQSHTFLYEAGGISSFGGVHSRQLKNHDNGTISIEDIKSAIRKKDVHFPPSRLICLENTHNRCSGMPLNINYINDVADIARNNNMSVHIDGARIFNAAVATGSSVSDLTKEVESVSCCLSKGLSAPSGSLPIITVFLPSLLIVLIYPPLALSITVNELTIKSVGPVSLFISFCISFLSTISFSNIELNSFLMSLSFDCMIAKLLNILVRYFTKYVRNTVYS